MARSTVRIRVDGVALDYGALDGCGYVLAA
jgi:hypothetical protein